MVIFIGNLAFSIIEILINVEFLEKKYVALEFIMRFQIVCSF